MFFPLIHFWSKAVDDVMVKSFPFPLYVETIVHSGFGFRVVETSIHIDLFIEVKRIFLLALTSLLLFSQIHLLCHKNDTAHILHMQMDG